MHHADAERCDLIGLVRRQLELQAADSALLVFVCDRAQSSSRSTVRRVQPRWLALCRRRVDSRNCAISHSARHSRSHRALVHRFTRPATGSTAVALAIYWPVVCPPAVTLISSTPRRAASSARLAARAIACRSTARRPTGASPNPSRACLTRRTGARLCGGTRWLDSTKCS